MLTESSGDRYGHRRVVAHRLSRPAIGGNRGFMWVLTHRHPGVVPLRHDSSAVDVLVDRHFGERQTGRNGRGCVGRAGTVSATFDVPTRDARGGASIARLESPSLVGSACSRFPAVVGRLMIRHSGD